MTPRRERAPSSVMTGASVGDYLIDQGGVSLHVERVEKDGRTTFVFAPKGSEAFVRAALAAQAAPHPAAGLDTILARGPHPVSFWALDVKKVVDIVRDAAGDDAPEALKTAAVGTDLSDVYGVTYLREDGGTAELVVSQRLIDQLKAAGMR